MNKNYRVVRITYNKKHSYTIMRLPEDGTRGDDLYGSEYYVEEGSLPELRNTMEDMIRALDKPVLEEKRELVEV